MAKKSESVVRKVAAQTPAAKPAAKSRKPAGAATPAARKPAARGNSSTPALPIEEVQLRAYFISENRRNAGLPGSEAEDWIEAERQIRAEKSSKSKKKS